MFIEAKRGYYRGTEQVSGHALYLMLFSWNDYKALDELIAACPTCQDLKLTRIAAIKFAEDHGYGVAYQAAYERPQKCDAHQGIHSGQEIPKYPGGNGKLWGAVRRVQLHQCGHFMMGAARLGRHRIGLSGPIGHDGLPLDLQDCPPEWRPRLVEVPEEVAARYWKDDGHNDVGKAAPDLRTWALANLAALRQQDGAQVKRRRRS